MGERDNQKLGGYLADRVRGEQSTRLPHHDEAAELARTADAVSEAYGRITGEGDELGSRYALMRHIEHDVALREARGGRFSWVWGLALAGATAVVFALIVLGAYVYGTQQGFKIAAANQANSVAIRQPDVRDTIPAVPPMPTQDKNKPPQGPSVTPVTSLDTSYKALISQAREISIKNGTKEEVANEQAQKMLDVIDRLNVARSEHNFDRRGGHLEEIVSDLRAVGDDSSTPDNALKLRSLLWAADVARMEAGNYTLARSVYSSADGLISRMLSDRASTGQETLYLQVAQTEVRCGVGYSDFLQNNDYRIMAVHTPSENGSPVGGPSD